MFPAFTTYISKLFSSLHTFSTNVCVLILLLSLMNTITILNNKNSDNYDRHYHASIVYVLGDCSSNDPIGTVLATPNDCQSPTSIVVNPIKDSIVVACMANNIIININVLISSSTDTIASSFTTLTTNTQCPAPMDVDYYTNTNSIIAACSGTGGGVISFPTTGTSTTITTLAPSSRCVASNAVAIDSSRSTVYAVCQSEVIKILLSSSGTATSITTAFSSCSTTRDVAFDPVKSIALATCGSNGVMSVSATGLPTSAVIIIPASQQCTAPNSIVVGYDSIGTSYYHISCYSVGGIISYVNANKIINSVPFSSCSIPSAVSVSSSNNVYAACRYLGVRASIFDNKNNNYNNSIITTSSTFCPNPYVITYDNKRSAVLAGCYGSDATKSGIIMLNCPVGYEMLGTCSPCAAGRFRSSLFQTACSVCLAGSYSESGAVKCTSCPIGQYSSVTGSSICSSCALGYYTSSSNSTICTACATGKYLLPSLFQCTLCGPGFFSNQSASTSCMQCFPGSYTLAHNASSCSLCESGKYADVSGSARCISCAPGTYMNMPGGTGCQKCPPFTYASTNGAVNCTYCSTAVVAGSVACISCEAGYYHGSSSCLPCEAGKYSDTRDAQACVNCPIGKYSLGSTSQCISCSVGEYSNTTGLSSCYRCGVGSISSLVLGSYNCSICPAGRYTNEVGSGQCLLCNPGTFSNVSGLSTCYPCNPLSFSNNVGSITCKPCSSSRGYGSISCTKCERGYYQSSSDTLPSSSSTTQCSACEPGKYNSVEDSTSCLNCDTGKYSLGSAIACIPCSIGEYSNKTGSSYCYKCGVGSISSSSTQSTNCTFCAAGSYNDKIGAGQCLLCEPGRFANVSSSSTCELCPIYTFTSNVGSINCSLCITSFSKGAQSCLNCEAGYYHGPSSCLPCEAGKYSDTRDAQACVNCPIGKYSSFSGSGSCISCSFGMFTNISGLSECFNCDVGSVSLLSSGSSGCSQCGRGKYSKTAGYECLLCTPNTYTLMNGSTACASCDEYPGLICAGGQVSIDVGYWGYVTNEMKVATIPCPTHLCIQGEIGAQCLPGRDNVDNNVLCGKCKPQYSMWNNECIDCSGGTNFGLIFLMILMCWVYVLVLHTISQAQNGSALIGGFLYFVQTAMLVVGPEASWLSWLSFLNFTPHQSSLMCPANLDDYQQMSISILISLLFFLLLAVNMTVHYFVRHILLTVSNKHHTDANASNNTTATDNNNRTINNNIKSKANNTKLMSLVNRLHTIVPLFSINSYIRTSTSLFLYSYSQVTSVVLAYLHCVKIGMYDVRVVYTVPTIDCDSEKYKSWLPIVILLLIFDVIAAPICLTAFLYYKREYFRVGGRKPQHKLNQFFQRYGVLFEPYRSEVYWWQSVVLLRRVICVMFNTFIITGLQWKMYGLAFTHFISLQVHIVVSPYKVTVDSFVERISLGLLVMLCGMLTANPPPYPQHLQIIIFIIIVLPIVAFVILFVKLKLDKIKEQRTGTRGLENRREKAIIRNSMEIEMEIKKPTTSTATTPNGIDAVSSNLSKQEIEYSGIRVENPLQNWNT